ncbi:MAG: hypothetical protein MI723_10660 [Caulobacterales bacterium]|nr:hypothetical protein [Caulobacterales bacterium]
MRRVFIALALGAAFAAPAFAQGGGGGDRQGLADRIMMADLDGDGAVTGAELAEARARQFDRLDTDGDGRVLLADLPDRDTGGRFSRGADRLDPDGDGVIEREAFVGDEPPFMKRMDSDGDGRITLEEVQAMESRMSRFRAWGGGSPPGDQ